MNILIKNLSNTYNYGSMMMGENIITYFNKYSKNVINYYIETDDEVHIKRLKNATNYDRIYKNDINQELSTSGNKIIKKIKNIFAKRKLYKKYQKKYNYIIILGGDDYSEEYYDIKTEGRYIIHMLKDIENLNKMVPIYMIGQTIGPYTGQRKKIASWVFNSIKLYTRDENNYNYLLKELNCKANKMHDLAFLDLNLQSQDHSNILKKYNLKSNEYIAFVGTGLMHHYSSNNNDVVNKFNNIIELVKNKYPNKKIVWLSHVVGSYSSDNKMLNILKNINKINNITIVDEELLPIEARTILGNAYFSLSCRMHAAVSSFQMGKPCICFSYSPKYAGVIGKEFNMENIVIESKNPIYFEKNNNYLETETINAIKLIDENYDDICNRIKERVNIIKSENINIIKNMLKEMEK